MTSGRIAGPPGGDTAGGDSAWGEGAGKLILTGEHAVVYGHLAIAGAVSRRTRVEARRVAGPSGIAASDVQDPRVWPALATVVPPEGVRLTITSDLPVGCGMGSSAALAIATVRAVAALEGEAPTFEEVHARAFRVERAFHGNPSGIDHAVSALGGLLAYRRTPDGPRFEPLPLRGGLALVVINTGHPGDTAAMVAGVAARGCREDLAAIGAVAEQVRRVLEAGSDLARTGALLDENHTLLQRIGVSTPALDAAVVALRAAGARGAKLAGAGGGGVAFGLFAPEEVEEVAARLREAGHDAFALALGAP